MGIMSVLWLILAIAVWGVVHSLLASAPVKSFVQQRLGKPADQIYRLAYNAFSLISFAPILWLVRFLPDRLLYSVQMPWVLLFLIGELLATIGLLVAVLQTDALALVGLRQMAGGEERSQLTTGGLYRYVRHPMYLFGLLIIWLTPLMTLNMLVTCIALTVYIWAGAYFEEKKLAREYGAAYLDYKSRTPMILPLPVRSRAATGARK